MNKSQNSQHNNDFLINEMTLINKAVEIASLSDLAIVELIRRCSVTLRLKYYSEIVRGDYLKPLGYLNYIINQIYTY